ncbi:MAG: energy transducer TonB [Pseudomonadota bacterium]
MFRISGLFSIALTVTLGVFLFWTSQSVQDAERALYKKNKLINKEVETIRVLETEWDYLNRPQRLERLAAEGIGVEEGQNPSIIHSASSIPEPVIPIIPSIKPVSYSAIEPASGEPSQGNISIYSDREVFEELLQEVEGAQR